MNADVDRANEIVWAYLHGELDEAARGTLEQQLPQDGALRERLERARHLDRWVRDAAPQLGADGPAALDEALTEEAVAAWERDCPAVAKAACAPVPGVIRAQTPRFNVFRRPAVGFAGLAAAALLILAVSPALLGPRRARWSDPVFVPLALRGASETAVGHTVDKGAARRCQEALMQALARAEAVRGRSLPPGLVFSFRLQELRGGAFSVCVQARLRNGRPAGEWGGDFSNMAAFTGHVDSSAATIAEELSVSSGAEGVGGRP